MIDVDELTATLAARRRARRIRAIFVLIAAFAALLASLMPWPTSGILYAIAAPAAIAAVTFSVLSTRASRAAAHFAAGLYESDPALDILRTLPKPVIVRARKLISIRSKP